MLLTRLQGLISGIYDVSVAHNVYDFLVTDRGHLPAAVREGETDEELIVAEPVAGEHDGEVGMSLYLDPAMLERLALADPMVRLHEGNVADYWTALEGVSHFLYLAWNAGLEIFERIVDQVGEDLLHGQAVADDVRHRIDPDFRLRLRGLMRHRRDDRLHQFLGIDPHRLELTPAFAGEIEDRRDQPIHLGDR